MSRGEFSREKRLARVDRGEECNCLTAGGVLWGIPRFVIEEVMLQGRFRVAHGCPYDLILCEDLTSKYVGKLGDFNLFSLFTT